MKNVELQIKPALLLLLHDKFVIYSRKKYGNNAKYHIKDKKFYEWLLQKELISQMEYDRLIKEE